MNLSYKKIETTDLDIVATVSNILDDYNIETNEEEFCELVSLAQKEESLEFNNLLDTIVKEKEVKVLFLMKKGLSMPLGKIICNQKLDTNDFEFGQLERQKLTLIPIDEKVIEVKDNSVQPLYTGSSLWSCNCHQNFLHTVFRDKCDVCKTNIKQSTQKTKMIQFIFGE